MRLEFLVTGMYISDACESVRQLPLVFRAQVNLTPPPRIVKENRTTLAADGRMLQITKADLNMRTLIRRIVYLFNITPLF